MRGRARIVVWHPRVLSHRMEFEGTILVCDAVYMHRSVAALGCDILVQRVPRNTLDIMIVFRNFMYAFTIDSRKDSRAVVCAASDHVLACRTPRQIVHLHSRTPECDPRLPELLFVLHFFRGQITPI